jgi:uncharacterized membrane protein
VIAPRHALGIVQRRLAALRRAALAEVEDTNRLVYHVLRGGLVASAGFVVFSAILALAGGAPLPEVSVPLRALGGDFLQLTPSGLMSLGVLVLIFTPMVRVAASLLSFVKDRDRPYVVVTAIVLVNLLVGLSLGFP